MILSRWQLLLTLTPHLHPLPFSKGRGDPSPGRRRACSTTRFDRVLVASPKYRYVAPGGRSPARRFPVFLPSCSFGVRSRVRYCTVTSVPTGISEKNLRAVSSGNRMQPCDAG